MTQHLVDAADRAIELAADLLSDAPSTATAAAHMVYMAGLIRGALALDSTPSQPAPKPSNELGPITDRHTAAIIGFSATTAPGPNRKRPVVR